MTVGSVAAARGRATVAIAIGLAGLVAARQRGAVTAYVSLHRWLHELGVPPALRQLDGALILIATAWIGAAVATRSRPWLALGLAGPWPAGLAFGLLAALPMAVTAALHGAGPTVNARTFEVALLGPFAEELLFRGLLVVVPVAVLGVRFWPCAVFAGLVFGSAHVPWSSSLGVGHAGTFLVTTAAGIWYAWLLLRLRWNLSATITLHAAMNASWALVGVGGGAVGSGIWPNVGRILTIALGTWLALRAAHRRRDGSPD